MAEYLHGVYGQIQSAGSPVSELSQNAFVYVGTAPVHTIEGGAENVNKPVLVCSIAEAKKKFGYSEDFGSYTLCEAMNAHFNLNGVGPLVLINVLDPAKHRAEQAGTKNAVPEKGKVTIAGAETIILDSIAVSRGETALTKGEDYTASYNADKKCIVIAETESGSLGSESLTITYRTIAPSAVTAADVIGTSDGCGLNTGIHAIQSVHQLTGTIPSFLLAPGFSEVPEVHAAMAANASKINGHWDAYMLSDIPISSNNTPVTMATAAAWKENNGYNLENETVYFPTATGTDGKRYHLATLAAANLQALLAEQDGIPYRTASNTECPIIENLYLGEGSEGRVFDDTVVNEKLCKNGIASAAFCGGKWVIWGAHSADYSQSNGDSINVSETNRMMLLHISNDFQFRRSGNIDKPLTVNDLQAIVAEEQARIDALLKVGALIYGEVQLNGTAQDMSDIMSGDYSITFQVTTTPLAKSLTAHVNWTDEGFTTYFGSFTEQ